ncbi:MAG: hypothetical protein AAF909_15035 [Pseudomonadota bacterium]
MAQARAVVDLANVAVIAGGAMLGITYIVSPDIRRQVEVNLTNRAAWYYLGKYVERPGDADHGPGGWEGAPEGCEKPERTFYHVAWSEAAPFETDVFDALPGKILISINETPTAGRTGHIDDPRFSDNDIVSLAPPGRCYFVKQVAARPLGPRPACNGAVLESTAYWAEMTFVTCD